MATSTQTHGWQIDSHTDQIEVTSNLPYPDPRWHFTDTNGHEHAYVNDGDHYPTLTYVQDGIDYVDDGDGYVDEIPYGHYECAICGEHITPGSTVDNFRRFIPGFRTVTATSPDGRVLHLDAAQIDALGTCSTTEAAVAMLESFCL